MNSANRSFFALVAAALMPYVLLGVFGCGVLSLAAYRVTAHGLSGLDRNGQDLRPAVLFFTVVTTGTTVAALSVCRQLRATRALAAALRPLTSEMTAELATAAERNGLAGRIDLVDDPEPFSFTFGVFAPRVVVSRGLLAALEPEALDAVLQHECYHVRNRDTVKMIVARAMPRAFFFLPALGHLRGRYVAGRELAADRRAVRRVGRRPLVSALYQVLDEPAVSTFGAAAALGGSEFLELRIQQLETGREPAMARVPRWAWMVTVAALAGMSAAFLATVAATRTSMTMMSDAGSQSPGAAALGVIGGVMCSAGWAWVSWVVWRRVVGHDRLTLQPHSSTSLTS